MSRRKWKSGQPDNWSYGHEEGEDCAGILNDGLWNDFYCEDLLNYICEAPAESCRCPPRAAQHVAPEF